VVGSRPFLSWDLKGTWVVVHLNALGERLGIVGCGRRPDGVDVVDLEKACRWTAITVIDGASS
jgi:hypothetical protein